ncbi:hypothetical protein POX_e07143 [Penicillium oxalicum]|uniref:hypothetical protein n=1 Tax=Penicillium oxalicum TaxID=69781 RepID=UPI0020B677E5|nr:hypothetical protein POX_e07143 [Penicillium oxalicum]KAI2789115.1 hypothetical protein POX_e07143 [Penicillium oxalicum]
MRPVMSFDDVAWDESERIVECWVFQFCRPQIGEAAAGTMLEKHHPGEPIDFTVIGRGSYNICFRMKFDASPPAVIRFPLPATLRFPEEKTRNEAAVMRYLAKHTSIPVPRVIYQGKTTESQLSLGPFIIMEYLDHRSTVYSSLNTPGRPLDLRAVLDPNINEQKLEDLYGQIAEILLQLSLQSFTRIGSLKENHTSTWEVSFRPHTLNMEQMCVMGTLPSPQLPAPDRTFETASSYLESIAEVMIQHLRHQRNDAVESADDCRRKFVARRLFQRLAQEGKLMDPSHDNGPFKLWCDDLRPSNVVVDGNDRVCGVLDWEFTYAAPVEYTYAPPWWLLIEKPEYWNAGLESWTDFYTQRLEVFLNAMTKREDAAIADAKMTEEQRLSTHMRKSWNSGQFWIVYASQHSFAFDLIYWEKIDPMFFGINDNPETAWRDRLALFNKKELAEMEILVQKKLLEMRKRELAWDCDECTEFLSTRMAIAWTENPSSAEKLKTNIELLANSDQTGTMGPSAMSHTCSGCGGAVNGADDSRLRTNLHSHGNEAIQVCDHGGFMVYPHIQDGFHSCNGCDGTCDQALPPDSSSDSKTDGACQTEKNSNSPIQHSIDSFTSLSMYRAIIEWDKMKKGEERMAKPGSCSLA